MTKPKFQTAYAPHDRVTKTFPDPSLAQQSSRDECDINKIMERFEKTGLMEHVNQHQGDYGDYTNVQDYHTSVNQVLAARAAFESVPATIRRRFDNDPGQFLAFVGDPANEDEMREMGLLPKTSDAPVAPDAPIDPPLVPTEPREEANPPRPGGTT